MPSAHIAVNLKLLLKIKCIFKNNVECVHFNLKNMSLHSGHKVIFPRFSYRKVS